MPRFKRRDVLIAASAVYASVALRAAAGSGDSNPLGGWREALLVVRDAAPWIETLTSVGGWEVAWRGDPDSGLNLLWSLPATARSQQTLMRNTGTHSGYIRLVTVTGAPQEKIRPNDQAWESGGISALDVRVLDIESTRKALELRGWNGPADPIRYTTYGFDVVQWAPRSPDGVRLSFIQRIAPPLAGWDELKFWSRATNAAIIVKDMSIAQSFVTAGLGLKQISQSNTVGSGGPNVMGLPWLLNAHLKTDIRGFAGIPAGDGAIEFISVPEAQGRDFSERAHPPNLGLAGLRFMVDDVAALAQRLATHGFAPLRPIQTMQIAPYGDVGALGLSSIDGVWFEFVQLGH